MTDRNRQVRAAIVLAAILVVGGLVYLYFTWGGP